MAIDLAPTPAPPQPSEGVIHCSWRMDRDMFVQSGTTLFRFSQDGLVRPYLLIRYHGDWVYLTLDEGRAINGRTPPSGDWSKYVYANVRKEDFFTAVRRDDYPVTYSDPSMRRWALNQIRNLFHFGQLEGWLQPVRGLSWEEVVARLRWNGSSNHFKGISVA